MLAIKLETTDPHYNLAAEEYFLKNKDEDCFILWQNAPAIIVGKNQNTLSQINYEKTKQLNIPVVRRMSGGGCVYHDLGNVNYTFIVEGGQDDFLNFQKFTDPVIKTLNKMGVPACLSGRNDLLVEGKKFSGNAQYVYKNRVLHHGTLMFDMDISVLGEVLNVNPEKIASKGIDSVKSRVTNLKDYLPADYMLAQFIDDVLGSVENKTLYTLSDQDLFAIEKLKTEKYDTWEWNFGYSPKYSFTKQSYLPCGMVEIGLEIVDGIIKQVSIQGDFFGRRDIAQFAQMLVGKQHNEGQIGTVLDSVTLSDYFFGGERSQILTCFF